MTEPGQDWSDLGVPITGDERTKGFDPDYVPRRGTGRERYMDEAERVIAEYAGQGLTLSTRGIAYRVAANLGVGHEQLDNIEDAVVMLRRAQRVGIYAVSDSRSDWDEPWVDDASDAATRLQEQLESLRSDRQDGQPYRLVLLVEAAGMMPILAPLADEYGVPVVSGSGSVPLSVTYRLAATAVNRYRKDGTPTVVLVITDFDLMGLRNIFVPLARDVAAFADYYDEADAVQVRRIAATPEQIREYIPANLRQGIPKIKQGQRMVEVPWWPAQFSLPAAEALAPWLPGIVRDAFDHYLSEPERRREQVEGEGELRTATAAELARLLAEMAGE